MKKLSIAIVVLAALLVSQASAQEVYFGKNKVRYKDFDWSFLQTRHFDIYFYENAYPTAKFCAAVMESAYVEISNELNFKITKRIPTFIYNSHNDFQQTNITPTLLPEGVGGFTEALKTRIVIPFTGSYEDFRHVLHHELTHAVVYNMLFGNSLASLLSRRRLFDLPLWYAEGYAEYSSRHGWDYFSDMFVRDATVNGYLAPTNRLGGFLAYKEGQALVKFIADKYGEQKLGEILQKGKVHLTMSKALKSAVGITEEELWKDFSKEMKRRYWPSIATLEEADEIGKQLTKAREDGSYFNVQPTFSPDGDKLAIFTDKSDFTEIVLISATDGRTLKHLVKSQRSGDLESLHSYVSGMSFSPDGKNLVFVAKSKGKEAIMFLNLKKKDVYKKKILTFYNILSPAWSPDGQKVAFSALDGHKRDLYIYHIEEDRIEQVTDDRYDDIDPSWMANSDEVVFSSDRPHHRNPNREESYQPYVSHGGAYMPGDFEYGFYNLFRVPLETKRVIPVDVGPGENSNPKVSPDGRKVAFISNRNGIDNIYVGYLDSLAHYAVTDILTGVRSITWSPDGEELAFSAFYKGAFDIFVLKDLVPAGINGVLALTEFMKGDFNLLKDPVTGELAQQKPDPNKAPPLLAFAVDPEKAVAVPIDAAADEATDNASEESIEKPEEQPEPAGDATQSPADNTEATDTDKAIEETGVYDDEYVFISSQSESALDSALLDVSRDGAFGAHTKRNTAIFDSIPPLLPSGEYDIQKYKVKFTPDFIGGGFTYDNFFGFRGQTFFVFSDYLGDHQIYLATDIVNTIDQSFVQAYYFNNKKRTSLGGGVFHSKNFYIDSEDFLFSDRFYGIQGFARRPFSTFSRLEFTLGQFFIDRKYLDDFRGDFRDNRSSKVTTAVAAYVFDNVLWGMTGPVNGRRAKISFDAGKNIFDSNDIEFASVDIDYRKYWHIDKTFSMALRFAGGASFGSTPKQYFLGGTTNWIGTRTVDARVYDVENLYFSEVVTPLRGLPIYGVSGDRFALANWEFRFPLIQYFAMRYPLPLAFSNIIGVLFTDVGKAWFDRDINVDTESINGRLPDDIHTGFGVGVRINLFGFALLRYDLAWATDWDTVRKPRSYFSFGADF